MESLRLVLCQMNSTEDVQANIEQALGLMAKIPEPRSVDLISLPENCLFLRVEDDTPVEGFDVDSPVFKPFIDFALEHKLFIHFGSVPLRQGEKLFSSSIIISDSGKVSAEYSKIHLFDVDVEGHKPVRESATFAPGVGPKVVRLRDWGVGLSICYDIRFAELFLYYSCHPVDLILVPAAFLVPTGKAHWEILLRARAIESQAFVAAAAQWGTHRGRRGSERETFGHSMIVDPWGKKLVEASDQVGLIEAQLERTQLKRVRQQIPMKNHRRIKCNFL